MSRSKVIIRESTSRRIIEQSRIRLLGVALFFILCFGSISVRMVEVAVLHKHVPATITVADPDNDKSEQVELGAISMEPQLQRGDIVDRNGVLLATSLMTASVFVNPKEIKDPKDAAQRIGIALGLDSGQMLKRLQSGKSFVWIKRNLSPKEQFAANALGIPGLYFLPEERRVYPYGNLFAHTIGYVGLDNKGLAGMERQFDSRLRDTDVNRQPLQLSLDARLQAIMHEEVKKAADEFQAIGAAGVILDIHSGEILSMVSLPDFNPNKAGKADDDAKFNRATLGTYEMGSTFKTFTMAMGLDYGVATMKSGYDATNPLRIATFTIKDDHPQSRFLTTPEIYAYSSNIGAAKMALDVGTKKQKEFLEKIGMMKPVELELPEKGYPMYPAEWKEINTVTISYGHGMSVTPMHLVRGIAAIVSGTVPRMTLLKDGAEGKAPGARVVSDETAKNMRRLMRLVVDHGTGSKADVPGYRVGGKTGTAEKVHNGSYAGNANLASFVAAFPVDNPRYVVLVMLDEPKGDASTHGFTTGGMISAPIVGGVISRMGPILGIKPEYDVPEDDAEKFWVGHDAPKTQQVATRAVYHAATY